LYDFPLGGDRLHLLIMKGLTLFTHDPYLVLNLFYALSFPLIALTAYLVLRHLGVHQLIAGAISVVYAWLPYHHWHGEQHPPFSAYYSVPLIILVALWALEGQLPLVPSIWRNWERGARRRRWAALVVIALVLGSASSYYAIFGVLIIFGAGVLRALRDHTIRPAIVASVAAALIGLVLVANLAPELLYRREHGANSEVANRLAAESENLGLHITQLLVPNPEHRIGVLGGLGGRAGNVPSPGEGGSYVGFLGVIGLVLGVGSLVWIRKPSRRERRIQWLGVLIVCTVLLGTVGGFGFTLAILGFTQLRNWDRLAIVIAFMALTVVALIGSRFVEGVTRRRNSLLSTCVIVLITLLALADAIPPGTHPDFGAVSVVYQSDKNFYASMEAALPQNAMVFQLPVIPFPESPPVVNMGSYDHLRGYVLGSNKLRWSAGGVRGRISDWQESWAALPAEQMVEGLAAAGFNAIYVDSWGYTDGGGSISNQIEKVVGARAGTSDNGRMWWYDLRPLTQRLTATFGAQRLAEVGEAVVTTPNAAVDGSISFEEIGAVGPFRWMGDTGTITFNNLGADGRTMRLRTTVVGPAGSQFAIKGPGVDVHVVLSSTGTLVDITFALPKGTTELVLSTDAPPQPVAGDGRDLRIRLNGLVMADANVVDTLGRG
jgi:hypothetical protein